MTDAAPIDIEISKHLREIADELAEKLESIVGRRVNFSLLVYSPVENSRMNYISNGSREDVQTALKSLIKGWEDGMPDIPSHEMQS